jgi:hypothetical protein
VRLKAMGPGEIKASPKVSSDNADGKTVEKTIKVGD